MNKHLVVQDALINIFKVGISKASIKGVVKTIHNEITKILGEKKALNFYIALHIRDDIYTIPYFRDEKDKDPIDTPISLEGGLTEYIRKIKKPMLIDIDKQKKLQKYGLIDLVGNDSYEWIGCPLIFKKTFYGILSVQTYDKNIKYSNADLKLLDYVSKNISITIARIKEDELLANYKRNLETEISLKNKELLLTNKKLQKEITKVKKNEIIQKVIFNISEFKNRQMSSSELTKKIHKVLSQLIDVENFYVAIKEGKDKGDFFFPYLKDINPEESSRQSQSLNIPYSFTDYVYTKQKPLMANKEELLQIESTTNYKMVGIKPEIWIGLPLKTINHNILGVVTVQNYSDKNAYSKTDLKVLSLISTTIADALEFRQLENHKKTLETKLIESQKMETIGIFAAGISHEFNNLLSIIIGNAHIGMINSNHDDQIHKRFKKIIKSGESASDLIEKLMIFTSFRKNSKYISYNIKDVLNSIISELKKEKHSKAKFSSNIEHNLWRLNIDREDIILILSNLLSNSIDALNKEGNIQISISNYYGNPKEISHEFQNYLKISIKDNGIGISKKSLKKIYDPFYTTKDPGKGTGLGLSMVYAIIKEHEGVIKFATELAKGTTVTIFLPAIKQKGGQNG